MTRLDVWIEREVWTPVAGRGGSYLPPEASLTWLGTMTDASGRRSVR